MTTRELDWEYLNEVARAFGFGTTDRLLGFLDRTTGDDPKWATNLPEVIGSLRSTIENEDGGWPSLSRHRLKHIRLADTALTAEDLSKLLTALRKLAQVIVTALPRDDPHFERRIRKADELLAVDHVDWLTKLLPAYVADPLVGRERLLSFIRHVFLEHTAVRILCLKGSPGVGKTRIARAALTESVLSERFADGRYCLDAASTEADLLAALAAQLHTQPTMLGSELLGRSLLIVLDDVWNPDAHSRLIAMVAAAKRCVLLMTTRDDNETRWADLEMKIPCLGPDSGVHLLRSTVESRSRREFTGEDELRDLNALACHLEGLPLTLQVAASLLARSEQGPGALLQQIKASSRSLMERSLPPDRLAPTVAAVLDLSYNRLSEPDKKRYVALARVIPLPLNDLMLQAAWGLAGEADTFVVAKEQFRHCGLVEELTGDFGIRFYRVHSLIIEHAGYLKNRSGDRG